MSIPARPKRGFTVGCTFVVSVVITAFLAFGGALGLLTELTSKHPRGDPYVGRAVLIVGVVGAICAFFIMVAKRLYAEWRGEKVEHVIPVWLAVPLAFGIGVGALVTMFTSDRYTYGSGSGAGIFIGYAATTTWRWLKGRRRAASSPE